MKPPVISIVQRGYQDRYGFQRLFLRYSWSYKTNYIALSWKLLPKDWDQTTQTVRPRATLGGETAAVVNGDLAKTLNKAYSIIADLIANELPPTFDAFKLKMGAEKKAAFLFFDAAVKLLDEEYAGKQISASTLKVYKAAINKFKEINGDLRMQELTRDQVVAFKRNIVQGGKENMANQYVKYLKIIYSRVLKQYKLADVHKPFEDVSIRIVKISEKKSMTMGEYLTFRKALADYAPESSEYETIRRFLIMCRGLRFSDTTQIQKTQHYFTFEDGGTKFQYLTVNAQKTGTKGIVPISASDEVLLQWQPDGLLFEKLQYPVYVKRLKKLSLELIGREITTHFGRHFTGDFILNSTGMGLDDVKAIIGVKSDRIAEIYAQKDIKEVLKKFYKAVEGMEEA
ncbi:MAG: phage integrase SAM-like domain-containing protein [Saprospiraceae bacterium]|jgi:integrase|nr:phage integrase SAM-like domain-containing protein [Saprospiraceae bacterium]